MDAAPTDQSRRMPWKKHSKVLLVAGFVILVRCLFRLIEYIQGKTGSLQSKEVFLYVLDAGAMLIVMIIFHFYHPSEVGSLLKGGKVAKLFKIVDVEKCAEQVSSCDDVELSAGVVQVHGK